MQNKIILGTAQFSNDYGITNKQKLTKININEIIKEARNFQVNMIDTAPDYKDVERKLGLHNLLNFKIISKIALIDKNIPLDIKKVENNILSSLKNLRLKKLYAILVRNPLNILKNKPLLNKILLLKEKGLIEKLGFTLYNPGELDKLYDLLKPDIVQIPHSIIDNRFDKKGWINKMYEDNVEIHVRSVFLQGVLTEDFKNLPNFFLQFKEYFFKFDSWLEQNKISKLEACLNHSIKDNRISKIVVGINSKKNLKEVLRVKHLKKLQFPVWLSSNDKNLIMPSRWKVSN